MLTSIFVTPIKITKINNSVKKCTFNKKNQQLVNFNLKLFCLKAKKIKIISWWYW
jgi:hypothetical protein